MLGFKIKKSIASYEEVANARINQENKEAKELNNKNSNKVVTSANKNLLLSAASKKVILKMYLKLCWRKNITVTYLI